MNKQTDQELKEWIKNKDIDGREIMFEFTDKDRQELEEIFEKAGQEERERINKKIDNYEPSWTRTENIKVSYKGFLKAVKKELKKKIENV